MKTVIHLTRQPPQGVIDLSLLPRPGVIDLDLLPHPGVAVPTARFLVLLQREAACNLAPLLVRRALELDTLSPAARALEEKAIVRDLAMYEQNFGLRRSAPGTPA